MLSITGVWDLLVGRKNTSSFPFSRNNKNVMLQLENTAEEELVKCDKAYKQI
jgi:hypothetical protein